MNSLMELRENIFTEGGIYYRNIYYNFNIENSLYETLIKKELILNSLILYVKETGEVPSLDFIIN